MIYADFETIERNSKNMLTKKLLTIEVYFSPTFQFSLSAAALCMYLYEYTRIQCVGGVWIHRRGGGFRQINTCRKVPLQVNFFKMTTFSFGFFIDIYSMSAQIRAEKLPFSIVPNVLWIAVRTHELLPQWHPPAVVGISADAGRSCCCWCPNRSWCLIVVGAISALQCLPIVVASCCCRSAVADILASSGVPACCV